MPSDVLHVSIYLGRKDWGHLQYYLLVGRKCRLLVALQLTVQLDTDLARIGRAVLLPLYYFVLIRDNKGKGWTCCIVDR